jgi:transcriptional regulator with XRE-family HTH domain
MILENLIIKKIQKVADNQNFTQGQLAKQCGVTQPQISKFFSGKTLQSDAIFRMLERLGVKIIFPGETLSEKTSCTTPEAARIDEVIRAMRKINMTDAAICAAIQREVEAMFKKDLPSDELEERKLAS